MKNKPYIGDPRGDSLRKTIEVFVRKIRRIGPLKGSNLLDVGCGDGSFTIPLSHDYSKVTGLDIQEPFLTIFRSKVNDNSKFEIINMSAEEMTFENDSFDTIITIETIEHIPNLTKASKEFYRVLKKGGDLIITCPNRFFPFENHGMRLGNKEIHARIPLLPYLPFLHDRLSLARVFTEQSLDRIFLPLGFEKKKVDYLWPTFEHGGNKLQPLLRPLFGLMRRMEESWLRFFGTSILIRYVKI